MKKKSQPSPQSQTSRSFLSKNIILIIIAVVVLGVIAIVFGCCGFIALIPSDSTSTSPQVDEETEPISEVKGEKTEKEKEPEEEKVVLYNVTSITDGDTIKIDYNGTTEKVRLIGIDTPETKECFYLEAKKKLESLLEGKDVEIEQDSSQGERDEYTRLLLYVWLDGENINQKMIQQGYAHEYTYNLPYKYQKEFKQSQQDARFNKLGLWGDACACTKGTEVGRTCVSCNKAKVTYYFWNCSTYEEEITDTSCTAGCYVAPEPEPEPEPTPTPPPVSPPAPAYVCDCGRTCTEMTTCDEAKFQLNCGCSIRDGDNDGVPCENLCPGG